MMLRRHELFPIVDRIRTEVRTRIAYVIAKNVLFEIGFRVRRMYPAKPIQTRKERVLRVGAPAIDAGVAPPASNRIRLRGRHSVDKLTETVNYERAHRMQASVAPSIRNGTDATVSVREYAGRAFTGKVTRSAGALDPELHVMSTEIQVPHVDRVSTCELRDPVVVGIEAESYDPARGRVASHQRDVVA